MATDVHRVDGCHQLLAADIVEVDVDAVGRHTGQALGRPLGPVVERVVVAELLHEHPHLLRPAGAAHHTGRPEQLGEAPGRAAHRPRRGADEHHVASLHLAGALQADPCGEPGLPEHAQPGAGGRGVGVHHGGRRGIDDRMVAPPHPVSQHGPRGEALTRQHDADRRAVQRLADLEVRRVLLLRGLQTAAHGGVHAHHDVAQQHLARLQGGDRPFLDGEVRGDRAVGAGAALEGDEAGGGGQHGVSFGVSRARGGARGSRGRGWRPRTAPPSPRSSGCRAPMWRPASRR